MDFSAKAAIQGNARQESQKELAGVELMQSPAAPSSINVAV